MKRLLIFFTLILSLLFFPKTSFAQEFTSNCVVTKVGNPKTQPVLPPECQEAPAPAPEKAPGSGIIYPPQELECISAEGEKTKRRDGTTITGIKGEYCKMPPSLDGAYKNVPRGEWNRWGPQVWGSKEMIGVLYTIAKRWQEYYCKPEDISSKKCKAQLQIRDMTSAYHIHHFWGNGVDLTATTNGTDCVADFARGNCNKNYNARATVRLGEIIVDTGYMHEIIHNGDTRPITAIDPDTLKPKQKKSNVNKEIYLYAQSKYPNRFKQKRYSAKIRPGVIHVGGHDNHFHLYIDRDQDNYKNNSNFRKVFDRSKLKTCTSFKGIGCNRIK